MRFSFGRLLCIHLPQQCRRFASSSGDFSNGGIVNTKVTSYSGKEDQIFSLAQSKRKTGSGVSVSFSLCFVPQDLEKVPNA